MWYDGECAPHWLQCRVHSMNIHMHSVPAMRALHRAATIKAQTRCVWQHMCVESQPKPTSTQSKTGRACFHSLAFNHRAKTTVWPTAKFLYNGQSYALQTCHRIRWAQLLLLNRLLDCLLRGAVHHLLHPFPRLRSSPPTPGLSWRMVGCWTTMQSQWLPTKVQPEVREIRQCLEALSKYICIFIYVYNLPYEFICAYYMYIHMWR